MKMGKNISVFSSLSLLCFFLFVIKRTIGSGAIAICDTTDSLPVNLVVWGRCVLDRTVRSFSYFLFFSLPSMWLKLSLVDVSWAYGISVIPTQRISLERFHRFSKTITIVGRLSRPILTSITSPQTEKNLNNVHYCWLVYGGRDNFYK